MDHVCNTVDIYVPGTLVFASLSLNVVDIDYLMPCSSNNDNDVNNGWGNVLPLCSEWIAAYFCRVLYFFKYYAVLPIDYKMDVEYLAV